MPGPGRRYRPPGPLGKWTALRVRRLRRELREEFLGTAIHLFLRQILLASGDGPPVTVRIGNAAGPVTPELIAQLSHRPWLHLSPGLHRAVEERIGVRYIDP